MDEKVFELIRSNWGNKRYLAWEEWFRQHPISFPVGEFCSRMVEIDAELKLANKD